MTSIYRPVETKVWRDRKIRALSLPAKALWQFLLTAPTTCAIPGVVIGSPAALADDLGVTLEVFEALFEELFQVELPVRRGERLIWLQNGLRKTPPKNPNMVTGWAKCWDDIPEEPLKHEIWQALKISCKSWAKLFGSLFAEPFGGLLPAVLPGLFAKQNHQEQEQEQEQETLASASDARARISAPSASELPESSAPAEADRLAISAPIAQAHVAGKAAGSGAPAPLADSAVDRWCTARWDEVNAHRARIAAAKGLETPRPLHPMDDGRRELATRMREGYAREDIAHVIAVIVAEAEATSSLRWLGGAMFGKRRVDNALARSVADAKAASSATPARPRDDGMLVLPERPVDEAEVAKRKAAADAIIAAYANRTPEQVAAANAERQRKLDAMREQSRIDNARVGEPLT